MVTEQVEESLEGKSPIVRGSKSHERTFEIQAIDQEGGIEANIVDVQIEERYSPMHYELSRDAPFVGNPTSNKEDIIGTNGDRAKRPIPATPKPSHSIAVLFETISGESYYMRWSVGMSSSREELLSVLLSEARDGLSPDDPIVAVYEPNSDTGGSLKLEYNSKKLVTSNRRAFEGEPSEKYTNDSELISRVKSWIDYEKEAQNGNGWIECPIVNAYEGEDGEEVSLVVETPLGEATAFDFEVTPDKSSTYWTVLENLAHGDPANLSDSNNSVYLRHRSRSFYNLNVSEHRDLIRNDGDVLSFDVNREWEMKTRNDESSTEPGESKTSENLLDLVPFL